jgi:hypothetical protein
VSLRGSAASAYLDFAHDRYWVERTRDNNPLLDQFYVSRSAAAQIARGAWANLGRFVSATLRSQPGTGTFGESIFNSISAFYRGIGSGMDRRLTADFGADVIALCERWVAEAGAASAAPPRPIVTDDRPPVAKPTVLVVGGTGFIGRRLVRLLADRGVGVRVLSRSRTTARLALSGIPVEIVGGSHDDRVVLARPWRASRPSTTWPRRTESAGTTTCGVTSSRRVCWRKRLWNTAFAVSSTQARSTRTIRPTPAP